MIDNQSNYLKQLRIMLPRLMRLMRLMILEDLTPDAICGLAVPLISWADDFSWSKLNG